MEGEEKIEVKVWCGRRRARIKKRLRVSTKDLIHSR